MPKLFTPPTGEPDDLKKIPGIGPTLDEPVTELRSRQLGVLHEAGGSRPALESFKAFRGREPSLDALLRHQGMA